jgi:hypothetical protein
VQISVIVAIIQTNYIPSWMATKMLVHVGRKALKIVVGKVSLRVALMEGLVGPKCQGNTVKTRK